MCCCLWGEYMVLKSCAGLFLPSYESIHFFASHDTRLDPKRLVCLHSSFLNQYVSFILAIDSIDTYHTKHLMIPSLLIKSFFHDHDTNKHKHMLKPTAVWFSSLTMTDCRGEERHPDGSSQQLMGRSTYYLQDRVLKQGEEDLNEWWSLMLMHSRLNPNFPLT